MKSSRFSHIAGDHGLTTFSGALAIISTCVGGGIVSLPLSYYNLGIPVALTLNILVIFSVIYSAKLFLAIKDACPDKPESLFEIGYMILGRPSIFIQAAILIVNSMGLCMVYFIVFGDTTGQLVASIAGEEWTENFYTCRWFYDVILCVVLIPIVLKKELAEMAWVGYTLFGCLGIFVLLNFIELVFDSRFTRGPLTTEEILAPKIGMSTLSSLSVTLLAYSYQ